MRYDLANTLLVTGCLVSACASDPETAPTSGPATLPKVELLAPVSPIVQDGARHLVYELVVGNHDERALTLVSIALAGDGALAPQRFEGDALADMTLVLAADGEKLPTGTPIPPAGRAVVFLWQTLPIDGPLPRRLAHTVVVAHVGDAPTTLAVPVAVDDVPPPVLRPPLHGDGWFSVNAPKNTSQHRRSVQRIDGKLYTAQRYALDFVRVRGPEGSHSGDAKANASYFAYGEKVLAMADGVVLEVVDGIPENVPDPELRAVTMTLTTLAGNAVVVDHGGGVYATYAHLIPGRIAVTKGQRVEVGAVLGRVGNSGNSTEPHLHLHVCDAPSLLACHGRPYAFDHFVETAVIMAANGPPSVLPPETRAAALPIDQALLGFAEAPAEP